MTRRRLSQAQRVAIAELMALVEICMASNKKAVRAMGPILMSRCQNLITGRAQPMCFTPADAQIVAEELAIIAPELEALNPPETRH